METQAGLAILWMMGHSTVAVIGDALYIDKSETSIHMLGRHTDSRLFLSADHLSKNQAPSSCSLYPCGCSKYLHLLMGRTPHRDLPVYPLCSCLPTLLWSSWTVRSEWKPSKKLSLILSYSFGSSKKLDLLVKFVSFDDYSIASSSRFINHWFFRDVKFIEAFRIYWVGSPWASLLNTEGNPMRFLKKSNRSFRLVKHCFSPVFELSSNISQVGSSLFSDVHNLTRKEWYLESIAIPFL